VAKPLRVLLIEDSEDDALLLLRELRKGGFAPASQRVDTAAGMRGALDAQEWEVIISDHAMPQFSALDALAVYQEKGLDLPFIIVSGAIGEAVAVEAMRSGAHDYVLKDNLARLTAAIERELHEAAERRGRRRAEEEAARVGREWSETFDAMASAVGLLGLDYRLLRANRALAALAERRPEDLVGESYPELMWGQAELPAALAVSPHGASDLTFTRLAPDRIFEVRLHPILDESDAPRAYVQIARDVTEARQLQAQFLQAQKLAALGEVISGIAHELNNPLAAVVAHAQLLRRYTLPREASETARAVEDSALRAARVVHSLLTFARQQSPERVALSLNAVVEETLALQAPLLRADNTELRVTLAPDLPPVLGDGHQLQQVLLNLVSNAQRAMTGRPVRRLSLTTENSRNRVRVRVQDTGAGIPEELLGRIFEPFFTTQEVGKGTGLGLSVCHGIIEDHGGSISVSSRAEEGTEFVIELPATQQALPFAAAAEAAAPLPPGLPVLVVEDEMLIRLALLRVLEDMGAAVDTAANGRAALTALADHSYRAIICDFKMPGMDGKQLYREAIERWPELAGRFIFCTGDTMSAETVAFVKQTGTRLLPKPFLTHDVQAALSAVLRAH
jgi:hypothetical protein